MVSTVPYTVIQVRLDCGVRLFSNPVGVEAGALRIGLPVEAVFEDITSDVTLLKFKPRKAASMKAMVVRVPGGTDVLKIEQIPDPTPGPKDVVIKVDACGVCFHDIVTRNGTLKFGRADAVHPWARNLRDRDRGRP